MNDNEFHAVKGSAARITKSGKNDEPFNPRLYHRGMTDLQEYLLQINASKYAHWPIDSDKEPSEHVYNKNNSTITVAEDSALDEVTRAIPTGWDASVVVDANDNYDGWYTVVMCLRCGSEVNIWVKTKISNHHHIDNVSIETTDITDRSNMLTAEDISIRASSEVIARLMRNTTQMISIGYANTISSGMKAFDYSMTTQKPSNHTVDCNIAPINQSYWADVRGVTRQTITNNLSEARNDLIETGVEDIHGDPLPALYAKQTPALCYTDSKEEAYVRLV